MPRLRLYDVRSSRLPALVGLCQADTPSIASFVNSAQRRLLTCRESGDEGWNGTWAEVAFNLVSRSNPYLTCPREIARVEKVQVCQSPVWIQNQFYEYLDFGNGRMPQVLRDDFCMVQGYTRNNVITFADQTVFPCILRVYTTDSADAQSGTRILFQGLDVSNSVVYSQDVLNQVQGVFVTFAFPFADCPTQFNRITGIQKDVTVGQVQIFQVDPTTGDQTLLLTMEPGETVAGYRRYFLNNLPFACCHVTPVTTTNLQVTAIVKLELIPVAVDTDYLLFTNLEAIIEECQSIRYGEMDNEEAQKLAALHHLNAVRYLQGELVHVYGKERPAISFSPFGTARLCRQKIGTLM